MGSIWDPLGAQREEKEGGIRGSPSGGVFGYASGAHFGPFWEHFGRILGRFFTDVWGTLGEHLGTGNPKECQRNTEEKTKK